jgi:peroxiredoxin
LTASPSTEPSSGLPPTGTSVPDFATRNQHGEIVNSVDLRGRPTMLMFYPWAFSGICTGEFADLTSRRDELTGRGVRVLAISCDAMFTLRAFADAEKLPFELLTDHWPHGRIARSFGVFDEAAGAALRGSFVLDRNGVIRWSTVNGIGEPRDMDAHLAAVAAL